MADTYDALVAMLIHEKQHGCRFVRFIHFDGSSNEYPINALVLTPIIAAEDAVPEIRELVMQRPLNYLPSTLEAAATPPTSDAVREALERLAQAAEGLRGWERLDGTEAMDEEYHVGVAALDAEALATITAALTDRADAAKVARIVTAANRYLDISYTPSSVQCLDIANEFIAAKAALAPQPTHEEADAL